VIQICALRSLTQNVVNHFGQGISAPLPKISSLQDIGPARNGSLMPAKKKKSTTKKDACYRKVSRAMPQNSAYRSGHMVRCRKVGAKNYNIGGKKSGSKK